MKHIHTPENKCSFRSKGRSAMQSTSAVDHSIQEIPRSVRFASFRCEGGKSKTEVPEENKKKQLQKQQRKTHTKLATWRKRMETKKRKQKKRERQGEKNPYKKRKRKSSDFIGKDKKINNKVSETKR